MTFRAFAQVYAVACTLLPEKMNTREAQAMVHAICLQESELEERRQKGGGPARGFPQFEMIGVREVLRHPASQAHIRHVLDALCYDYEPLTSYTAIEHNDVLALVYARLALWRFPGRLPRRDEPDEGWSQYLKIWVPGKPRPQPWGANFAQAWKFTEGEP